MLLGPVEGTERLCIQLCAVTDDLSCLKVTVTERREPLGTGTGLVISIIRP